MKKLTRRTAQPRAMRPVSAEYSGEYAYHAKPELSGRKKAKNAVLKLGALAGISAALMVGVKERSTVIDKVGAVSGNVIEKITPITKGEISDTYKKNLQPTAVNIANRAIELSKSENFKMQNGDDSATITASNLSDTGQLNYVSVKMELTDGKPDPKKVQSISMQQPFRGDFNSTKSLDITSAETSDTGAWDGKVYVDGAMQIEGTSERGLIAYTQDPGSNSEFGLSNFDYQGQSQQLAQEADQMFTQITQVLQR